MTNIYTCNFKKFNPFTSSDINIKLRIVISKDDPFGPMRAINQLITHFHELAQPLEECEYVSHTDKYVVESNKAYYTYFVFEDHITINKQWKYGYGPSDIETYVYEKEKVCDLTQNPSVRGFNWKPIIYILPSPKTVLENWKNGKCYTTVVWMDGTHTIVKKAIDDDYDLEKAVMAAVIKKMCGNNGCKMRRYLKSFFDHTCVTGKDKEVDNA